MSTEQSHILSPDLCDSRGKAAYTTLKGNFRALLDLGGGGVLLKSIFSASAYMAIIDYFTRLCYALAAYSPSTQRLPVTELERLLFFPGWPEIGNTYQCRGQNWLCSCNIRDLSGPHTDALSFQVQQPDVLRSPSLRPLRRNRRKHLVVICPLVLTREVCCPALHPALPHHRNACPHSQRRLSFLGHGKFYLLQPSFAQC